MSRRCVARQRQEKLLTQSQWFLLITLRHCGLKSKGRWNEESLLQSIKLGHQHLWLAFDEDHKIDGVGTTELVSYPAKRMLTIQFLGGDKFNDWVWDMLERFTDWAIDNNCDGIEATARMGFWKWLQQDGFERSYVVYERSLRDE